MHSYGFSTGALALGDFRAGLSILSDQDATAVELSALRDHELPDLIRAIPDLDLSAYEYVSVHAPSRFSSLTEGQCADLLSTCIGRGWPIVLHPDSIRDPAAWEAFGSLLCIENMDKRKADGRTVDELTRWYERFPRATFCLDLGHARQVDPSLTLARALLRRFGDRLAQIHLSELNSRSQHYPLSVGTVLSLQDLAASLRSPVAVILESRVGADEVGSELHLARVTLEPTLGLAIGMDAGARTGGDLSRARQG